MEVQREAIRAITTQKYRTRILDVGKDAPGLVLTAYHQTTTAEYQAMFGWPYLDEQSGGVLPGDVISFGTA